MTSAFKTTTRRKIIGVLIRAARERAEKTANACAAVVGRSAKAFRKIEGGDDDITLSELASLAEFLGVPLVYFFDEDITLDDLDAIRLRREQVVYHQQLADVLREARQRANLTQAELAEQVGCSVRTISQYERGNRDISAAHLARLAEELRIPLPQVLSDVARTPTTPGSPDFLPDEVRRFVYNEENLAYLRAAMQLRELSPLDAQRMITVLSAVVERALPGTDGANHDT